MEEVAHMMREALDTAFLILFDSSGMLAMYWKDTVGKRGSMWCWSAKRRELRVRLMMVQEVIEEKVVRWRRR